MKLAYETLEIWQLAMKLVEITHSLRKQFPKEEKYRLWSQLVNAVESTPLLIAEGYGRKTSPDRAHFMDQAIASNLEAKTAYQISAKKEYVTKSQFEKQISPLIEKIHFKTIGFKKYLLKEKSSERSDQPTHPNEVINRLTRIQNGFTLIEILVVVGILAIIVVVGSTSFFNLLRGSTKTKITSLVKGNGNHALGVMTRMIRNARRISVCNPSMASIEISNPDGNLTEFSCDGDTISSNSAAIISSQVKVKSGSCSFSCQEGGSLQPDVVTISFTLTQAEGAVRPEEQISIDFKTTVNLRNISD